MDRCAKGFGIVTQLFSDTASDARSAPGWQHIFNHHHHHQTVQRAEVLCPEPRRAVRVPSLVEDNLTRLFSVTSSSLGVDCGLEILGIILSQNEQDAADSETSYFRGTPPARTGNPLIHDSEFVNQHTSFSATASSPLAGSSHGHHHHRHHGVGGVLSPRGGGATPCGSSSSFSGKPKVRIEGFASGSSSTPPFRVATALA